MNEISFNILPAGLDLPLYHAYSRRTTDKNGAFVALSGGGNRIFGKAGNRPVFTANGQDFIARFLPAGVSSMDSILSAATAGNTTLALFRSSTVSNSMPMQTLSAFSSLNSWAFQPTSLPQGVVENSWQGYSLATDQSAFYLVGGFSSYAMPGGSSTSIRIWKRGVSSTNWSTNTDIPIVSSNYYYNSSNSPVVTLASIGSTLGSIHMMTVELDTGYYMMPGAAPIRALLRSTDGGNSWQAVSNAPALISVAYDAKNARFVGSSLDGVWTSANGATGWSRRSSNNVGRILYSTNQQLLFSVSGGVSADGSTWLPYADAFNSYGAPSSAPNPFGTDPSQVFAAGSAVFRSFGGGQQLYYSQQLTKTYVPTAWPSNQRGQVNKVFSYEIPVD
jgi:hypothetical protein